MKNSLWHVGIARNIPLGPLTPLAASPHPHAADAPSTVARLDPSLITLPVPRTLPTSAIRTPPTGGIGTDAVRTHTYVTPKKGTTHVTSRSQVLGETRSGGHRAD